MSYGLWTPSSVRPQDEDDGGEEEESDVGGNLLFFLSSQVISHAPAPSLHGLWRSSPDLSSSFLLRAYSLADLHCHYIMFKYQNCNRPAEIGTTQEAFQEQGKDPGHRGIQPTVMPSASVKQRGRYACTVAPLCQYNRQSTQSANTPPVEFRVSYSCSGC